MSRFTKISADVFNQIQIDAGVLLSTFDPTDPDEPADADIICATTGGITINCVPTYSDFGEDVDNVPPNMMEFKHLDGWDCNMSFSNIKLNPSGIALALGAATTTAATTTAPAKIVPNGELADTDFQDLWWVGDKVGGGAVAVCLKNALSTGGFVMTTTKNGKGSISMTVTGHVSIDAQDEMPMEFYDIAPAT